jgi:hypothetical protein
MMEQRGTESLSKAAAQSKLETKGITGKDTAEMVHLIENTVLDNIPKDATTLRKWIERAREILA